MLMSPDKDKITVPSCHFSVVWLYACTRTGHNLVMRHLCRVPLAALLPQVSSLSLLFLPLLLSLPLLRESAINPGYKLGSGGGGGGGI